MASSKQRKNRQQRRKRQQAGTGGPRPQQASQRILFPDPEQPVLEVHITPGTSREVKDLCVAYWAFHQPGAWDRKVSELGVAHQVLKQVRAASHASLLTLVCRGCASPSTASSRSEVQATALWQVGEVPGEPVEMKALCPACQEAAAAARAQETAAAEAAEEARQQQRLDNASAWMARQKDRPYADQDPDTLGALTVLAIADIVERTGKDTIGPLKDAAYTLTGSSTSDTTVLNDLYGQRWIMPALPAVLGDFAFNDDDTVSGVYIAQVPWALASWLGPDVSEACDCARDCINATLHGEVDEIRDTVLDLETGIAVAYLEGLLARQHREEPIPEHRLPDAHATIRAALDSGFTLGQIIAVCWSAAAGSVAWGQRTPGLKPGSVAAACVTNLARRIGYAKDRPVVEYDLPNWVSKPAVHATALRWLAKHDAAATAAAETMHAFRSMQQRVNSQPLDAIELADDLADRGPGSPLMGLASSEPAPDTGPQVTFGIVRPDGTLSVECATVRRMREIAGEPYGMTDRIPIEGTRGLIALIPEFADTTVHPSNTVAAVMLELLGAGDGPVNGTVVFCRTDQGNTLGGLTSDLGTLVGLAHDVSLQQLLG